MDSVRILGNFGESMKAYIQFDAMDCGPTCLRMIAKHYGKTYSLQYLREHCFITREGVSMLGISEAAEHIGLKTLCAKITLEQLCDLMELPCILHWISSNLEGEDVGVAMEVTRGPNFGEMEDSE